MEGFYTEGGEYFTIDKLDYRKLAYNLTRRRIAVFPSDDICGQMLGMILICDEYSDDVEIEYFKKNDPHHHHYCIRHGAAIVCDDAVWCFLDGGYDSDYRLDLLLFHGRNIFDEIIDDCLTYNNKKKVENRTTPVNALTTGVEKYYLMIDWDAVDEDNRREREKQKMMQKFDQESDDD